MRASHGCGYIAMRVGKELRLLVAKAREQTFGKAKEWGMRGRGHIDVESKHIERGPGPRVGQPLLPRISLPDGH